jgi:oligopeptide/dipeptide ABC transporter ATP-binding protein
MTDAAPLLQLADVTHDFRIGPKLGRARYLRAVDGVTLDISRGEVVSIVGESGSGKTTLAKVMLGLIDPTHGRVAFQGRALSEIPRRELARKIQFIFQDPQSSLNPMRTIGSILMQPMKIAQAAAPDEIEREARRMLDVVGLPKVMFDRTPGQLSGGQRQRVVIARALILRPEVVVCDEPTSALDVSVQAQILNLLLDLRQEFGLTYVFISHNLSVVKHIATRVAVMYLGRIVEQGEAEEIFAQPRHPYTRALLQSIMPPVPRGGIPNLKLSGQMPSPMSTWTACRFNTRCPDVLSTCRTTMPPHVTREQGFVECHLYGNASSPST